MICGRNFPEQGRHWRATLEKNRAPALVQEAAAVLTGTDSGWVDPQVSRLRILVNSLNEIVTRGGDFDPGPARKDLDREAKFYSDESDPVTLEFFDALAYAFEEFRADPAQAVAGGKLPHALILLGRIPLIGTQVAHAISPAIGSKAIGEIMGPIRTWMYRPLEAISDEESLRVIVLRLA